MPGVDKSQGSSNENNDKIVDTILAANQVLFDILPELTFQPEIEKQMALLIPNFIDNLGSPKVSYCFFTQFLI